MTTPIFEGLPSVTIHVTNIARAKKFWTEVIGLKDVSGKPEEGIKGATFQIPGSSTMLSMHEPFPNDTGRMPGTVSGLVFKVKSVQWARDEIVRRGGTLTDAPTPSPWGGQFGFFADPDGNEFVIAGP